MGLGALLEPECCWSWISLVEEYVRRGLDANAVRHTSLGLAAAAVRRFDLSENMTGMSLAESSIQIHGRVCVVVVLCGVGRER